MNKHQRHNYVREKGGRGTFKKLQRSDLLPSNLVQTTHKND